VEGERKEGRREREKLTSSLFVYRDNRPMIGDILVGRAPYFKVSPLSPLSLPLQTTPSIPTDLHRIHQQI
jgi:hypothetical protein